MSNMLPPGGNGGPPERRGSFQSPTGPLSGPDRLPTQPVLPNPVGRPDQQSMLPSPRVGETPPPHHARRRQPMVDLPQAATGDLTPAHPDDPTTTNQQSPLSEPQTLPSRSSVVFSSAAAHEASDTPQRGDEAKTEQTSVARAGETIINDPELAAHLQAAAELLGDEGVDQVLRSSQRFDETPSSIPQPDGRRMDF